MSAKIIVPDDYPVAISGTEAEKKLLTLGEVKIYNDRAETQNDLIKRIKDAQVVVNIRAYSKFNRDVLNECSSLRMISIWGTGTDNVDLKAAKQLGITVTNTPGANALSVAEHTIAIMLAAARQIPLLDRGTRAGEWPRVEMTQLSGKVLGVIGLGAIGRHVARMARGLGMEVVAWTRRPSPQRAAESGVTFVSKEQLLKTSDVVSLHLGLNEETRGFLKKEDFSLMKQTALFVNTARAGLIEEGALLDALQEKKIAAAALDAYDREPLPADDPLTALPNVVLTPHNAGMTPEATNTGLMMTVENAGDFLSGRGVKAEHLVVEGTR
ncbi:MAG: phosphoglycerate dehydrogenase [Deltaproteobacteria bacterium]|nr:phosphoglycerate dehydrogenase [Deltaproteobacteria bacterium]MBW2152641.1 phosphoglycerate dehydrogenase [Deltaproteobacteria bacterium]